MTYRLKDTSGTSIKQEAEATQGKGGISSKKGGTKEKGGVIFQIGDQIRRTW